MGSEIEVSAKEAEAAYNNAIRGLDASEVQTIIKSPLPCETDSESVKHVKETYRTYASVSFGVTYGEGGMSHRV